MAVAVVEREQINSVGALKKADEAHNARIKNNYAMLINPDTKIDDLLCREEASVAAAAPAVNFAPAAPAVNFAPAAPAREAYVSRPYLVENARADSILFRADSPINRRENAVAQVNAQAECDDEDNEDLRPTATTIQYKTAVADKSATEGKISNHGAEKRVKLNKKEKIIVAVVVGVIVALLALIIINAAYISNLNSEISSLQSSLTDVTRAYSGISGQVRDFEAGIMDKVEEFARFHNMIKIS